MEQQIIGLIHQLYTSTDTTEISRIQAELTSIQSNSSSWSLIQPLLQHSDSQVSFFGACTLYHKLSNDFSELAVEDGVNLQSTILNYLMNATLQSYSVPAVPGQKLIMTKLVQCVVVLSYNAVWENWLLQVISRVAAAVPNQSLPVLNILSIIITQINRLPFTSSKRSTYLATLNSSIVHVVSTLTNSLQSNSIEEINAAILCFNEFLIANQLNNNHLITIYPLLLNHLFKLETINSTCSAIQEIIEKSSGVTTTNTTTRFMTRIRTQELIQTWATSNFVSTIVSQSITEQEINEESNSVMKLLCALGEHFVGFLFSTVPDSSPIVPLTLSSPATLHFLQLILAITLFPGHESYSTNELANGVWLALQEECSDIGLVKGSGDGREGRRGKEEDWNTVESIFVALANGLRLRCEWPKKEILDTWPKDMVDEFHNYRRTCIGETILYPYYILRDSMLMSFVSLASQQLAQPETERFESLESSLYAIYAIQEAVSADEDKYLPHLFSAGLIGSLPSTPSTTMLRSTTLRLVGAYAPWFANQPSSCLEAVQFVVKGLEEISLAPVAAKALVNLCNDSRKDLVQHVASFVQILGNLEGKLEDSEFIKVLESVASIIQALPPSEKIEPLLLISNPIIAKIISSLTPESLSPSQAHDLAIQQLSYLIACAKGLSDPEGDLYDLEDSFDDTEEREGLNRIFADERIIAMRVNLGSAIEGCARIWGGDAELVATISEYIKQSSTDSIPSPLGLDPSLLLQLSMGALSISVSPAWLAISSTLLARLARDGADYNLSEEAITRIARLVESGLTVVLRIVRDLETMKENPDIVYGFLSFANAILRHYPRVFIVLPDHLAAILDFAERGLLLQESFSLKATIELIISAVQQTKMASASSIIFQQVLTPRIPSIIEKAIIGIAGGVPRSQITTLSELLHVCCLRFREETKSTLAIILSRESWPNEKATDAAKRSFEKAIMSSRAGSAARSACSDFATICRMWA